MARLATTVLVCLGLVVPSAHGIALCVDSDGNVAVEAAVNGACAGTQAGCAEESSSGAEFSLQARNDDHCGSCRDVLLSGGSPRPPFANDSKTRRLERMSTDAASLTDDGSSFDDTLCCSSRFTAASTAVDRSPPCLNVVLRL